MKSFKYCLFTILILASVQVFAQPYRSMFGKDSTRWVILLFSPGEGHPDILSSGENFVLKDTIANSKHYKKVYRGYYSDFLLREDTILGKVWYTDLYPTLSNCWTEKLMMDLSLQVGDSFYFYNPGGYKKVDSVYFVNGRKHIRFNFTHNLYPVVKEEFIEEAGCSAGMTTQFCQVINLLDDVYLLCAYKDGVKTYSNPLFNGDCYPYGSPTSGVEIGNKNDAIKIIPNPAVDKINISFQASGAEKIAYIVTDVTGLKVLIGTLNGNSGDRNIDVRSLTPGMYNCQVSYTGRSAAHRFIKL